MTVCFDSIMTTDGRETKRSSEGFGYHARHPQMHAKAAFANFSSNTGSPLGWQQWPEALHSMGSCMHAVQLLHVVGSPTM